MATPNYSFIKRQKDLAKKAKKEEKKQAKLRGEVVSDSDEEEAAIESLSSDAVTPNDLAPAGEVLPNQLT
jgi:hypothetical protein